jgi:hypothetical protein
MRLLLHWHPRLLLRRQLLSLDALRQSCLYQRHASSIRALSSPYSSAAVVDSNSGRRSSEPLRILYCGSDGFSCVSLLALQELQAKSPEIVQSIDVLCRAPKKTGRGLKQLTPGNYSILLCFVKPILIFKEALDLLK